MADALAWQRIHDYCTQHGVTLVAVSKTKPATEVSALYALGQRHFGENYVQELVEKHEALPQDICWHFIGHLQSNKVKMIAPFVHLIHAVDSFKLLAEIAKQGAKCGRVINVLLQLHIAEEETKFGMDEKEVLECLAYYKAQIADMAHVRICGLMGMATNTPDEAEVKEEFGRLHNFFTYLKDTEFFGQPDFATCSMGMSADYEWAVAEGSNMIRVGSLLFGARTSAPEKTV